MATKATKGGRGPQATTPGRKGGAGGPGGRGGGPPGARGRKPITPVRVGKDRNWGPIAIFAAVILVAGGIIGYAFVSAQQQSAPWDERAAGIEGIVNFAETQPEVLQPFPDMQSHEPGDLTYPVNPPVGGTHNPAWQNCQGDVYTAPVASEHAVHSLEHGAVWITHDPALDAAQVDRLASRVRGQDKIFMSPFPGLDSPISLQAWGWQLKVTDADDGRIDEFIRALKVNASQEGPSARCDGVTTTGDLPIDLGAQTEG
jgi:hypothetical protein